MATNLKGNKKRRREISFSPRPKFSMIYWKAFLSHKIPRLNFCISFFSFSDKKSFIPSLPHK